MDKRNGIDKHLAIHALTLLDKKLAEIRTVLSSTEQVSSTVLNEMDRMLVFTSLSYLAVTKMIQLKFTEGNEISEEAGKWWKQ